MSILAFARRALKEKKKTLKCSQDVILNDVCYQSYYVVNITCCQGSLYYCISRTDEVMGESSGQVKGNTADKTKIESTGGL